MKPCVKHWKRVLLAAMVCWALLCLMLYTYCMDSRVEEPRSSVPQSHADTRRLTSIQADNRATVGSRPATRPDPPRTRKAEGRPPAARGPLTVAAPPTSAKEAGGPRPQQGTEELRGKNEEVRSLGKTMLLNERHGELQEVYSNARLVISKLWKGDASARMLSDRLQRAQKSYLSMNKHRAHFGGRRRTQLRARDLLCEIKKQVRVRTLDGSEEPFSTLGWGRLVPTRPLEKLYPAQFSTCAVVSSAGAILHSSLGKEIDSHEAVLRFNGAPTKGYEKDVGNKTTIRIMNSQILAKPEHHFRTSSLYRDVTLVGWDPAPYTVNLQKWYRNPDFDLFRPYVERRKRYPAQPFYILHPAFLWQLWDLVQGHTQEDIQPNVPSSGFIGIILMMSLCKEVDVYEYIPSVRQTTLCHYHEQYYDMACTLGAYHPLLYEKMLVQHMNIGSEREVQMNGKVTLSGFSAVNCDS